MDCTRFDNKEKNMEIVKVESTDEEMLVIQKGTIKEYIKEYVKAFYYAYGHFNTFSRHQRIAFLFIPLEMCVCWTIFDELSRRSISAYSIVGGIEGILGLYAYITGNWKVIIWPFLFMSHGFKLLMKIRFTTLEFQGVAYRFTKAGYSMSLLREIPNCNESCLETWRKEVVGRQYTAYKEMVIWVCERKVPMEIMATADLSLPGLVAFPLCVFSTKDKNVHVVEEKLLRLGFEKR